MFKFLSVFIFSILIKTNNKWKYAEQKKLNAELSFLKAQINPHFLFNTLNSIYSTAITENAKNTSTAVVKLSALMRYITSVSNQQFVPLSKELEYIRNYIDLQKIAFRKQFNLFIK
jgi:sensor histidine kinase YesM